MSNPHLLPCDGCGQLADSAHISRRLERLAWTTRFRPVHIQALLLSGVSPKLDCDFLYSPNAPFHGEAAAILDAVQITTEGKSPETVQAEFQKLGVLVTHVLECPLDERASESDKHAFIEKQLSTALARIRRSLKPKRVLLLSGDLQPHADDLRQANLGCPILPGASGVFLSTTPVTEAGLQAFRSALAISNAHSV
jgi:hypothetical protein